MGTPTGTTKARGRKHALDKFYTKTGAAQDCLSRLELQRYARVIEPSAGGGAFSDLLFATPGLHVEAYDLEPENPRVVRQDWFAYATPGTDTLVVGNPPFGQQSSLAVRFINHAFEVVGAQTVAFVLPRGFRKASVQRRIFRCATLVLDVDLAPASFTLRGEDYGLPAIFQVWERTATAREVVDLPTTSPYFAFTRQGDPHDFAVRRIGGRAGHAFDDTTTSVQSNYFLRLTAPVPRERAISLLNEQDYSVASHGTGPRTLAKGELVAIADAAFSSWLNGRGVTSAMSNVTPL